MLPQASSDTSISYVCSNPLCRAVSPRARTFHEALEKARKRAETPLVWHDRKTDPPTIPGQYLCKYTFGDVTPHSLFFYGVLSWYPEQRFQHEAFTGQAGRINIISWMDFQEKECAV